MVPARSSSLQFVPGGSSWLRYKRCFYYFQFHKVVSEIDSITHVNIFSVNANTPQPQTYVFIKAVRNRDPDYKDQV